jgi:circadian clock protein KaiB
VNDQSRHKQTSHSPGESELSAQPRQGPTQESYLLRLYVSGMTPNSLRAIDNVRKLCAEYLAGQHDLEIIDIYQQPALAKQGKIVVAPTLVKEQPLPTCRIVGNFSQLERILRELGVRP